MLAARSLALTRSQPIRLVAVRQLLTGWGRTPASAATIVRRRSSDRTGLAELVRSLPERGAIARGLGRSYGDSAQNGGGLAIRLDDELAPGAIEVDPGAGAVTAAGGVSLDGVLRVSIPRGLFVPVSPGTRFVTVGGAIASDIHGKNHHVDGTFGAHVQALTLLLADGTTVDIGPGRQPELFWATVGGMGLTGIIVRATIAMVPIETGRMTVDTERVGDLDELLDVMTTGDARVPVLGRVDRPARPGSGGRAQRVDPRRPRPRRGARPGTSCAPTGLSAGPRRHGAADRAGSRAAQPLHDRRLQRGVVPQGTAPASRRDRVDPAVLPSPRRHRILEPPLRQRRSGAVPVPRPVRPGGGVATCRDPLRRARHAEFPVRAQALRRRQPRSAELPGAGVDAHPRHPSRCRRPGSTCSPNSTKWSWQPVDGTISPRTRSPRQRPSAAGIRRLAEWQAVRDSVDPHGRWASDQSRRLRLTGWSREAER